MLTSISVVEAVNFLQKKNLCVATKTKIKLLIISGTSPWIIADFNVKHTSQYRVGWGFIIYHNIAGKFGRVKRFWWSAFTITKSKTLLSQSMHIASLYLYTHTN